METKKKLMKNGSQIDAAWTRTNTYKQYLVDSNF